MASVEETDKHFTGKQNVNGLHKGQCCLLQSKVGTLCPLTNHTYQGVTSCAGQPESETV